MKKWMLVIMASCVVISLLAFIQATDIGNAIASIRRLGYQFGWLILLTGIAYLFATLSWKYCIGDQSHSISTWRLFLIRQVGETISLFNPASIVGGDALKVLMLAHHGIDRNRVLVSVMLSRVILIASQLVLFLFTVSMLLIPYVGLNAANGGEKALGLSPFILAKTKSLWLKIVRLLGEFPSLFKQNRGALSWSVCFALLHWIFGALEFYLILSFLGLEVSILQALLIDLGVVFFKAAGAFIPGQLGVEEYGNKIMLMAIGIPNPEIWISVSILRRARQLIWIAFGVTVYFLLFRTPKPIEFKSESEMIQLK